MLGKALLALAALLIAALAMPALANTQEEAIAAFQALQARVEALESLTPIVRDSANKPVGAALELDKVLIEVDGRAFWRRLGSDESLTGEPLLYELELCQGTPFLPALRVAVEAGAVDDADIAYVTDSDVPRAWVEVNSTRSGSEACVDIGFTTLVRPAIPILDLGAEFVPPYGIGFQRGSRSPGPALRPRHVSPLWPAGCPARPPRLVPPWRGPLGPLP